MVIRTSEIRDRAKLTQLYKQFYPEYTASSIDLTSASFTAQYISLVYEEGDELYGYIVGTIISFGQTTIAYIEELYVDTAHRRKGIGTHLVMSFLDVLPIHLVQAVFVTTSFEHETENPIPFYEKLGFSTMRSSTLVKGL